MVEFLSKEEYDKLKEDNPTKYRTIKEFYKHISFTNEHFVVQIKSDGIGKFKNLEDALWERDLYIHYDGNWTDIVCDTRPNPYFEKKLPPFPKRKSCSIRIPFEHIKLEDINKEEFISKWNNPEFTIDDLMKEYNLSHHHIYKIKEKWDLSIKKKFGGFSKEAYIRNREIIESIDKEEFTRKWLNHNVSLGDLMKEYNLKHNVIYKIKKEWNLPTKARVYHINNEGLQPRHKKIIESIDKDEFIRKWHDSSITLKDLEKEYSLTSHLIYYIKKEWELPRKSSNPNLIGGFNEAILNIDKEEFTKDWSNPEYSVKILCQKYKISERVLYGLKNEWELPNNTWKTNKFKDYTFIKSQNNFFNEEDYKLVERMQIERRVKHSTMKGYDSALKTYTTYNKMHLQELLEEALKEQDARIPLRESKLKKRLIDFRTHLLNNSNSDKTVKTYFAKVKTFYTHFEVEIPILPTPKYHKGYLATYEDLPTHKMLQQAIGISDGLMRSIILFQSSSGSAKAETLSLTVKQFMDGIQPYHEYMITDKESIKKILEHIHNRLNQNREIIVPQFYLRRIKTDKWYYTFCTPEATEQLCLYLMSRLHYVYDVEEFLESPLFRGSSSLIMTYYQNINDTLDWGKIGKYRRFRSHVLRKFNASNIGLSMEDIDNIQGRSKDSTHEAYFKTRPDDLKERYMSKMWRVMINPEWISVCKKLDHTSYRTDSFVTPNQSTTNETKKGGNLEDLIKYGELVKNGLITNEEFDKIKASIIGGL